MKSKIKAYVFSIIAALAVGGLSSLVSGNNTDIYQSMNRPPLSPPSVVFPIVWTILFVLMGIGAAMVYLKSDEMPSSARGALSTYAAQLVANFLWTVIFFNLRMLWLAFFWLILLWALILAMILRFKRLSPAAAYLQLPYLLWVTFAGYLTLGAAILN